MTKHIEDFRSMELIYMKGQFYAKYRMGDVWASVYSTIAKYYLSIALLHQQLPKYENLVLSYPSRRFDLTNLDDLITIFEFAQKDEDEPRQITIAIMQAAFYAIELVESGVFK